jgi:iron-sulfur cluster assembly protein
MIKVTAAAARQILQAAAQTGAENMALRIAAKRTPDGSIEYGLGFDAERAKDTQLVCEGVTLLVSVHSMDLLKGVMLDFVELHPGQFEFIFINPNDADVDPQPAQGSGCGGGSCGGGGACGSGGGDARA